MAADQDDKTWIVALVVFGLMGVAAPVIALVLFFVIAAMS
ncbi:hypothetical protein HNQ40_001778 [Algisphaera agarilytica]|uniref:Uncharacterized protein n=1 Tax=Algisphaera agarilytica TaxID=1385975 RepID=A0A7X0H636_9BACT|nr:hypothetical protein [Algisphaera agarilytica]